MVLRLLAAAGAAGVERALLSTDGMGVAGGVARALAKRRASEGRLPELEFVELDALTGTADDTRALVSAMRARGAAVIVMLGGDGTVRAAAATCGDVPLLPLSTGTNNAFPEMWEATVAGTAAALLATGRVDAAAEDAPVEGAARRARAAPARSRWSMSASRPSPTSARRPCGSPRPCARSTAPSPSRTRSACPASPGSCTRRARTDPHGVAVTLGDPATAGATVLAPIAPGVVAADRRARGARAARRRPAARRRRARHGRRRRRARDRGRTGHAGHRHPRARRPPRPRRARHPRRRRRAPAARPPARPLHPSCRRSDEGSTVPRPRRHPYRRRTRADRRAGAGEGRRRVVRHLRHRPARVPRRADLHPAEGLAAPAHRPGDAGGDGPRVRRRDLGGRRRRHAT